MRPTNKVRVSETIIDSSGEEFRSHKNGVWLAVELDYVARNKPGQKFETVIRNNHGFIWHEIDGSGLVDTRTDANILVVGIPTKKRHLFEIPRKQIGKDLSISVFESGGLTQTPDNEIKIPVFHSDSFYKKVTPAKYRSKPIAFEEGQSW